MALTCAVMFRFVRKGLSTSRFVISALAAAGLCVPIRLTSSLVCGLNVVLFLSALSAISRMRSTAGAATLPPSIAAANFRQTSGKSSAYGLGWLVGW